MGIKKRLDEIAEELGHPRRPVGMSIEEFLRRVEDFCATRPWPEYQMQLIEEMRRLRHEQAKTKP